MKKIGALILLVFMLAASALTMASCSGSSDVPDGMQLVYGGKSAGYYFYAPEEWTVSNLNSVKSAYVSKLDTTSVSFAEIDPLANTDKTDAEEYFFGSYFEHSLAEFPNDINLTVTISDGESTLFGKSGEEADKAVKYTFNYEYSEHKFGFMQIFIKEGDRYFIFTYCSLLEEKSDGKTYYDYYLEEKVLDIIEQFRFTGTHEEEASKEFKKDKDGFLLISDSSLSGFDFYVPESFKYDYSSAIISATHSDGSNVNMAEATMTGNNMTVDNYFEIRKAELSAFVSEFVEIIKNEPVKIGNSDAAFSYEYTFVYNGERYRVYQIFAIEGPMLFQNGYVFTYTAKENNYSLHLDEINAIIEKVKFK